jgi:glyoxylase-like metal-dependent hydrolase (beta-lactamase superfamily II)
MECPNFLFVARRRKPVSKSELDPNFGTDIPLSELTPAGIGVSRPQITRALAGLGADPITHLINTHWHFDHADGNVWLNSAGAKIIAHENTRKHLSKVQRKGDRRRFRDPWHPR